jgi:iron(III) transport system substrate-binding protein
MISMNRIFLALCLLGSSAHPALVRAADDKMLELAKKEARVSFYTTMGADEAKMLADAFQSKYPSMRVEITRLGSERLLQRIITESRAGSHLFDAVTNSGMEIYLLTKMGLLTRYTSPEFSYLWPIRKIPPDDGSILFEPSDDRLQYPASAEGKGPKTL